MDNDPPYQPPTHDLNNAGYGPPGNRRKGRASESAAGQGNSSQPASHTPLSTAPGPARPGSAQPTPITGSDATRSNAASQRPKIIGGRLDDEERARRHTLNLCRYCGSAEHLVRDCALVQAKERRAAMMAAAAVIASTETTDSNRKRRRDGHDIDGGGPSRNQGGARTTPGKEERTPSESNRCKFQAYDPLAARGKAERRGYIDDCVTHWGLVLDQVLPQGLLGLLQPDVRQDLRNCSPRLLQRLCDLSSLTTGRPAAAGAVLTAALRDGVHLAEKPSGMAMAVVEAAHRRVSASLAALQASRAQENAVSSAPHQPPNTQTYAFLPPTPATRVTPQGHTSMGAASSGSSRTLGAASVASSPSQPTAPVPTTSTNRTQTSSPSSMVGNTSVASESLQAEMQAAYNELQALPARRVELLHKLDDRGAQNELVALVDREPDLRRKIEQIKAKQRGARTYQSASGSVGRPIEIDEH